MTAHLHASYHEFLNHIMSPHLGIMPIYPVYFIMQIINIIMLYHTHYEVNIGLMCHESVLCQGVSYFKLLNLGYKFLS